MKNLDKQKLLDWLNNENRNCRNIDQSWRNQRRYKLRIKMIIDEITSGEFDEDLTSVDQQLRDLESGMDSLSVRLAELESPDLNAEPAPVQAAEDKIKEIDDNFLDRLEFFVNDYKDENRKIHKRLSAVVDESAHNREDIKMQKHRMDRRLRRSD